MDSSCQPLPVDRGALRSYVAVTSGEGVDGNLYPWDHEREDETHLR